MKGHFNLENPRRVSEIWPGVEGNLDAAITDYDGDVYFMKVIVSTVRWHLRIVE